MRKHIWRTFFCFGLVTLFAGHVLAWYELPLLPQLESLLYDARVRTLASNTIDDRIVVVDIDEKSLREKDRGGEGRWPWRRDRLAQLLTDLFQKYGAALVATDIILSEKDESSGLDVLEQLAHDQLKNIPEFIAQLDRLRPSLLFDQRLSQAMTGGPVVLGYAFHNDKPAVNTRLPEGLASATWGLATLRAQSYPGYIGLLPDLQAQAAGAGHLNPLRDVDGVTRRVPMLIEHNSRYYPSLALAVVQKLTAAPPLGVVTEAYGEGTRVEMLTLGPIQVPVDGALNALVPFRGPAHSFTYVSAADVLQGKVSLNQFKNRIVLIGTSAAGLGDMVSTPVGVSFPGVEVHANLITGMLDDRLLQAPTYAPSVELLSVIFLGLMMVLGGIWLTPVYTLLLFFVVFAGTCALNVWLLTSQHLMLPIATPLGVLVCVLVFQMMYGFFIESRGKRQLSQLFANYVPPELVEKMAGNPSAFSMAPIERELTVLFADVRDFTSSSERLSPLELAEFINNYLTAMSIVIRDEHRGTLDKYIGDAVMAFWGAPYPNVRHAEDAVLAAMDMHREAQRLNLDFLAKGLPTLNIGIGLNTGPMSVGDMGSKIRRAYTVIGDAVNLGARLEGLTKNYGVGILIGENSRAQLDLWTCREVDRVRVKGKKQIIAIFEPLGRTAEISHAIQIELAQWEQALSAYRLQQWERSLGLLIQLLESNPQSILYALYAGRVKEFQLHPPPFNWDGAINFETK